MQQVFMIFSLFFFFVNWSMSRFANKLFNFCRFISDLITILFVNKNLVIKSYPRVRHGLSTDEFLLDDYPEESKRRGWGKRAGPAAADLDDTVTDLLAAATKRRGWGKRSSQNTAATDDVMQRLREWSIRDAWRDDVMSDNTFHHDAMSKE